MDFAKFDSEIDLEGLKAEVAKASELTTEYGEIPLGEYEVKIERLELTESKKGSPMLSVWFKIVEGVYKGQMIFMNQVLTQAFQIHICNEFLRSLETDQDVHFDGYQQYSEMVYAAFDFINNNHYEYALAYGEKKGFKTFKITEVFKDSVAF